VQTILFIELLGGIGDVLIALPAIQALGRAYPQAKLTVLTFAPGGELITSDPLIHAVVCLDRQQNHAPHLVRNAVEALLKRDRFDLIVSDTNYGGIDVLLQQSHTSRVVTNLWRSPPPDQKVDDRFLHILQAEGLITPADIAPAQLHLLPAEPLPCSNSLARSPSRSSSCIPMQGWQLSAGQRQTLCAWGKPYSNSTMPRLSCLLVQTLNNRRRLLKQWAGLHWYGHREPCENWQHSWQRLR